MKPAVSPTEHGSPVCSCGGPGHPRSEKMHCEGWISISQAAPCFSFFVCQEPGGWGPLGRVHRMSLPPPQKSLQSQRCGFLCVRTGLCILALWGALPWTLPKPVERVGTHRTGSDSPATSRPCSLRHIAPSLPGPQFLHRHHADVSVCSVPGPRDPRKPLGSWKLAIYAEEPGTREAAFLLKQVHGKASCIGSFRNQSSGPLEVPSMATTTPL